VIGALDIVNLTVLGIAGALALARVIREGSLADKVLGADNVNFVVVAAVAVGAGITADPTFLDVLVVVTLLGFIGNLTVARYIEKRGARD
jgi:multicomponent Na+:H+ antiporter subunit F